MKKLFKSNLISFIITGLIICTISVSAVAFINSTSVKYRKNNTDVSLKSAIDDLYDTANDCYGYSMGDEITVVGETYYVIADSSATQDYVVALKDVPITSNISNGGNSYNESPLKTVVDDWASQTFVNNELKEVNGYSARMITKDEFDNIPNSYSWRGSYNYWTMTHQSIYWCAVGGNDIGCYYQNGLPYVPLRPVVNVKKQYAVKSS